MIDTKKVLQFQILKVINFRYQGNGPYGKQNKNETLITTHPMHFFNIVQ